MPGSGSMYASMAKMAGQAEGEKRAVATQIHKQQQRNNTAKPSYVSFFYLNSKEAKVGTRTSKVEKKWQQSYSYSYLVSYLCLFLYSFPSCC